MQKSDILAGGGEKQKHKGAITESRTLGTNAKILSPSCHQHKLHNEGFLQKHRKLAGLQLTLSIIKVHCDEKLLTGVDVQDKLQDPNPFHSTVFTKILANI